MRAKEKRKNLALEEDVKLMEVGEVGLFGQVVEVIATNQDPEAAIIQLLSMEDLIVKETEKRKSLVLEETVKLMEVGEIGLLGQLVQVLVRNQEPEVAIIHLLSMEDLIVWVIEKRLKLALEEVVKLMEAGEVGHIGQVVEVIVRNQDPEVAMIHLLQMEE